MDYGSLVTTARSCRRFDAARPIPLSILVWLVDLARIAPCGANRQALRYVVCNDRTRNDRVFGALRWAAYLTDWDGPAEPERPAGYVGILAPREGGAGVRVDLGIAAQTIMLGAAAQGLGCCMIGAFDRAVVEEALEVPQDYEVQLVFAIGHPAERRVLAPLGEDESIRYWRDAQGVHHVPKRSLDDVLVGRFGDSNE